MTEARTNGPVTLILPSDLRLLGAARSFMESVCDAGCMDAASAGAVVMAVHEAVSNVIRHAHRDRPEARVQIDCYLAGDRVEVHVLDEGEPFDVTAVPELRPCELRIGGRGVFLMRTLMDELTCARRPERGNILRMVKLCRQNTRLFDCG